MFLDIMVVLVGLIILWRIDAMTEASENLAREVAETREAVTALTGRYQSKIDAMQVEIDALKEALANGDTEAATAAAQALDDLQTEMAALGQTPEPEPQPEPEPAPEEPAAEEGEQPTG